MTITRVKPTGWRTRETLTSAQQNQLDLNTTYGLDKRSGQTDTLSSGVTVGPGGALFFHSGSFLTIDPSGVTINPGVLKLGCELNGDNTANDPLRFGYNSVAVTSTSQTLTATQYNTFVIKFTGTLTGNTTIIFPAVAGYTKVIDNQTTAGFTLSVGLSGADPNAITVVQGKQVVVYCDGTKLNLASQTQQNQPIFINNIHEVSGYGTTYQTTSSTSYVDVTSYAFTYPNVVIGDRFEVSYRCGLASSADSATASVSVLDSQSGTLPETIFNAGGLTGSANKTFGVSISTVYTASIAGSHTLKMQFLINDGTKTATLTTPLAFTVKQIKV